MTAKKKTAEKGPSENDGKPKQDLATGSSKTTAKYTIERTKEDLKKITYKFVFPFGSSGNSYVKKIINKNVLYSAGPGPTGWFEIKIVTKTILDHISTDTLKSNAH